MATAPVVPPSPGAYLKIILISAVIGIPAALVATVFLALVTKMQEWLWQDLPDHLGDSSPPWYLVVGLPVVGAAVVVIARRWLPGDGGHDPINGLNAATTPLAAGPGVALAALGTLGFGAVLGPEAPLIALGSVVGLAVTPFIRLGEQGERVVGTAGAASAVSAVFGGPLVAGFLLMEVGVGMGSALIPALLPALVAAATGYSVILGLDNWGKIDQAGLTLPELPDYNSLSVRDLLIAVVVGVVAAIVMTVVHRIGVGTGGLRARRFGMAGLLLAGGLAVGLLAQTAGALGADTQDILFSGQDSLPALVGEDSARVLLVILVAKAIAYGICLGCGFRGGPVFPAIFLGVGLMMFAVLAFDVSPTLAVAVGAAAGMAAATRLLFASLLFSFLIVGTQGFEAIPAAVLAAAAAYVTVAALDRRAQAGAPEATPA
jgi:H+/Cl- antiporter ClcA